MILAFVSLGACRESVESLISGGTGTPVTPPADGTGATASGVPFWVTIDAIYDGTTDPNATVFSQLCTIPAGSPDYTTETCEAKIPEARLHFSKLRFRAGGFTNVARCEIVFFHPYYYRRSNAAAYIPPEADSPSPIICNAAPLPAGCFAGAAVDVVPGFPRYRGVYQLTAAATNAYIEFTSVNSANSHYTNSNRWTTNTLATASRGSNLSSSDDTYVANSMVDYEMICADKYAQPIYKFNITVDDINNDPDGSADDPANNQYPNWNSLLDPQ